MSKPFDHHNLCIRPAIAVTCLLVLASCGSQPEYPARPVTGKAAAEVQTGDIQDLLIAAEKSTSPQAEMYLLRAAKLALDGEEISRAGSILASISSSTLTADSTVLYIEYQAVFSLARKDPDRALDWLSADVQLSKEQQLRFAELRAQAYYEARRYLASARERIFFDMLLDDDARVYNHEEIWKSLMELPVRTLTNLANNALTSDLRGWLSLTAMSKQYQDDLNRQLQEFKKWQQIWSRHPAASQLPDRLNILTRLAREKPDKVALLLPLQGDLAPYGRAIRDGFLAAHYQALKLGGDSPVISVFDTSSADILDQYNSAVMDGAQFVVGPLDRENVSKINDAINLSVPVLALNRIQDPGLSTKRAIYQFGLAPEDEVTQVANQAWREGLRRVLVLMPDNEWGQRNFRVFLDRWLILGGEIADKKMFTSQKDYSTLVQSLLNVDASEKRASELRRIVRGSFEFDPRRRKDIDFILLLANPSQARGINPTLAFFFAEDLPVYATSHINDNSESRIDFMDLNGIRFCDIPWKLTRSNKLQLQIQSQWDSASGALAPFYALGVDAYHLFPRLEQLEKIPSDRIFGSTGVLRLDDQRVINRRLMWAQIKDGQVTPVPIVFDAPQRDTNE
jgi:outer membrane PBP1 activator LpoA protein